ncbi:MAG TPA: MGMT family protein [Nitrospirota bacterium]|nr:MGMT family protein [Nitrospirota bacterium]
MISSAGTLGGFSGGLGMKKKLLGIENIHHRDTETRRKRIKN